MQKCPTGEFCNLLGVSNEAAADTPTWQPDVICVQCSNEHMSGID